MSRLLRALWGLAFGLGLVAQAPFELARPALRSYGIEDGLPSAGVFDLTVDTKGRLWAATLQGAAFHTGGGWRAINPPSLGAAHVRTLLATRDGALWMGTQGDALWRLEGSRWTHIARSREFPSERVNCLLETRAPAGHSILWVGTGTAGVLRLEQGRWSRLGPEQGLPDQAVWKLRDIQEADGVRRIWAATPRGLCRLVEGQWQLIGAAEGFLGTHVNDILQVQEADGRSVIWVSGWSIGVARRDERGWTHFGPAQGFPSHHPTSLALSRGQDGKPILWVGTYDRGITWFDGQWHNLDEDHGFPSIGVNAVLALPEGKPRVWLGTRSNGVCSLDPGGWRTLDQRQGLPGLEVSAFLETQGGKAFWIATNNGLVRWEGGRRFLEGAEHGLAERYISSLALGRDAQGEELLWASSLRGLLQRKQGRWRLLSVADGVPPGVVNEVLETQAVDGRPILWVSSQHGLGRFTDGKWHFEPPRPGDPVASGALHESREGSGASFWVALQGGGLRRYQKGRWRSYGAEDGLPPVQVMGFLSLPSKDGRHWLWVGTAGGGLARLELDRPAARWTVFRPDRAQGNQGQYFARLVQDRWGRIYVGTPNGVLRVRMSEGPEGPIPAKVESFTLGDGLPSMACNFGGFRVDAQGRVWIGTSKGVAVLDPELESFAQLPPAPVFEQVTAGDGAQLAPGQRLGHWVKRLRFEFSLPVFHRKEDTRYRVQVMGLESEPGPWQKEPFRDLTALPAGRFTFRVWARDFAGWTSGPVDFPFEIRPALWASPWAYLVYLLGLGGLYWLALRVRTHLLRRRSQRLRLQVEERTQALSIANARLREANREQQEMNQVNTKLIEDLTQAIAEVKTLQGFIPICASCKKIRDDQGYWEQIEQYITRHSEATFSHGICPDCAHQLYPELFSEKGKPEA